MASIRSKHHSLLNYFLHDRKDLSTAYVRKCEEFIDSLGSNKLEDCFKMEIPKKEQRAGSIPPALKQGHGRAYYTNGPLVAGASSLPAKTSSRNKK